MKHLQLFEELNYTQPQLVEFKLVVNKIQVRGIEPSEEDKKIIDDIVGYENLYEVTKEWLRDKFNVFKKYDYEDMEDRLCEFFDKILNFDPMIMFCLSKDRSAMGIRYDKLNDQNYFISKIGDILNDINFNKFKPYDTISVNDYYKLVKPAFHINLNSFGANNSNTYNLLFIEDLVDKITKRFKYLYDIEYVTYDCIRDGRKYNPNIDINGYSFTMYLK